MPCSSIEVLLVTAAGFIAIARGVLDLLLVAVHVVDLGRGGRVLRLLVVPDAQETREPQRQALLGVGLQGGGGEGVKEKCVHRCVCK